LKITGVDDRDTPEASTPDEPAACVRVTAEFTLIGDDDAFPDTELLPDAAPDTELLTDAGRDAEFETEEARDAEPEVEPDGPPEVPAREAESEPEPEMVMEFDTDDLQR